MTKTWRQVEGIQDYPKDFAGFIGYYLQEHCTAPLAPVHRGFCEAIREQQIVIAAPRGAAKSYFFSFFYPLFLALTEPGVLIIPISATHMMSATIVRRLKKELEQNAFLQADFGLQKTEKWAEDHIILKNGSEIIARSVTSQVRGLRGAKSVVILDDAEDDESVITPEGRQKLADFIEKEVLPIRQTAASQVIMVGTIVHEDCYLRECLLGKREGWVGMTHKALQDDGTSLWPQVWTPLFLKQQKRQNADAFEQEYQNNPIPDRLRIFRREWFRYVPKAQVPDRCVRFLTVDPAIADGKKSDDTVICQTAIDADACLYVEACYGGHFNPHETISKLFEIYAHTTIHETAIETIAFQKVLHYMFLEECRKRKMYPRLTELESDGTRKIMRIQALQPLFQNGRIAFVEGAPGLEKLEQQLLGFPTARHDDYPDALAFVVKIMRPGAKAPPPPVHPNSFEAVLQELQQHHSAPVIWGNQWCR